MIEQQIIGKYGQCHFGLNHLSSTMAEKYAFLIRYIFRSDFVRVFSSFCFDFMEFLSVNIRDESSWSSNFLNRC